MAKCFVIMPLTTPASAVDQYGGDAEHFIHVLDHLFSPAVEAAGYELVRPIMRGADLIHAEIIKNLEQAELVLCDVSLLNANVFFELGIRTALDRPVALVKDDKTATYPFDTSMINYHSYDSSLAPWTLEPQIEALRLHLVDSGKRADGRNSLWRYFGLTQRGEPAHIADPVNAKLDLLVGEVEKLRTRENDAAPEPPARRLLQRARSIARADGAEIDLAAWTDERVVFAVRGEISDGGRLRIAELGEANGLSVAFVYD